MNAGDCPCAGRGWIERVTGTSDTGREILVAVPCPHHAPALPPRQGPPPESREIAERGRALDEQRFR